MTRTRFAICLALVVAAVGAAGAQAETTPTWRHALEARSTGLNREYHLGRFAVPASAATDAKPAWLVALEARGQAMNKRYELGAYADSHRGIDLKIPALVAALAAALAVVGAAFVRGTRRRESRVPTSA